VGLLALTSGSAESWRSDDDVANDPPVLRSGAGAKANVYRGAVASARAATTIFMVVTTMKIDQVTGGFYGR